MRGRVDPLGELLLRSGAINEDELADVLNEQRRNLPFASMCYALGLADEETLVRALSKQCGLPGVVLDRSVIELDLLEGVPQDIAQRHLVLPLFEEEDRLFVAVDNPDSVADVLRELELIRGKAALPHIALHITLARTLRGCFRARARGERFLVGPEVAGEDVAEFGVIIAVSDVDSIPHDAPMAAAQEAVLEDVTKEIFAVDLAEIEADTGVDELSVGRIEEVSTTGARTPVMRVTTELGERSEVEAAGRLGTITPLSEVDIAYDTNSEIIDLDEGEGAPLRPATGPARVLIVDDDFATRHLLVKELQPLGLVTATASGGGEAVRMIKSSPPNLVVIDVMLPEIDGFQISRAIKQSHKYNQIVVILMSAVIDSGRVTDELLRCHGADAYFEKPLNTERLKRRITDLLGGDSEQRRESVDASFERALQLYRAGKLDQAIESLRSGLKIDPLSAKHHFVLANLLQKQAMIYEAIDEYEATVDLKPDYFPALTRLAYLYYKKGYGAKAIEAWRRSLPHCPDDNLRQNIEVFMRKLIADMQQV